MCTSLRLWLDYLERVAVKKPDIKGWTFADLLERDTQYAYDKRWSNDKVFMFWLDYKWAWYELVIVDVDIIEGVYILFQEWPILSNSPVTFSSHLWYPYIFPVSYIMTLHIFQE
jgi:hypothetical protein